MLGLLTAVAAGAAASYAGYATMGPESQLYGRTLTHGGDPGQIALTYDDGPNDPHTLHLLDLLARYNAKATFFLIGKYAAKRPDIVRAIHEAGHAIGNHTYSHPNLIFVSPGRLRQELTDCAKAMADAGLEAGETRLFRPPFGGRRPDVLSTARGMGLLPVMWSVTGYDWSAASAGAIIGKVTRQVDRHRRGEVVLLHDGGHVAFGTDRSFTVEATRRLLQKYAEEGRRFVSVHDLVAAKS
ncbi:MAG TPA: polysaccharide deacetylase family protein [Candidatus Angelobacter sp.]|nr:polysaccharide deacetylase family protein [Candidatus Angelobacter sp.]